jgi:glycosyltransferase involved in cell wall biosynthesis
VADAVQQIAPARLPVQVMPHPLPPAQAQPDRAAFALPPDAVVVLTAFDVRSGFTRKNPIGAVRAYRRATARAAERSVMVCKVTGTEAAPDLYAGLRFEVGSAGDGILLDDWLTGAGMAALLACADIVLSLHRSEGFGLLPAQAMMAGKPVVATGWSGNLDYMTRDTAALVDYRLTPVDDPQGFYTSGFWADPDLDDAAVKLAALIDDPAARRALGQRAQRHAAQVLDPLRLGRQGRVWLGHTLETGD